MTETLLRPGELPVLEEHVGEPGAVLGMEPVEKGIERGTGWLPDWPDIRDYTPEHEEIKPMLRRLHVAKSSAPAKLPATVDLRSWFSAVEDQKTLGSCTANAAVGTLEYYERRAYGKYIDASRLFVYKVTRDLLGWTGDRGAFLRTTMGEMVLFGAPPEKYWPYDITKFDVEPGAFLYSFASDFKAIKYFRLDPPGTTPAALLDRIKLYLGSGLPAMFGFSVYSSITQARTTGLIPFPATGESVAGGHAIVAAGYDDAKVITNAPKGPTTTGALLIRNSWGTTWGQAGYGWLPYEYVLKSLATDWWTLLSAGWVDTGQFGLST